MGKYRPLTFAFKKVTFVDTPQVPFMATNLKTWELFINRPMWQRIGENTKVFMLCHEEEHLLSQTKNEFRTDGGGFRKYISSGRSLKDSVYSIVNFLDMNNPESRWRALLQLDRALQYDFEVNGNKRAYKPRYRKVEDAEAYFSKHNINGMLQNFNGGGAWIDEYGSLIGFDGTVLQFGDPSAIESGSYYYDNSGDQANLFGGKWRKKVKADKKGAKVAVKNSKAELQNAQAYATRTLADKGIAFNPGSKFAQGVGAVGGLIGSIIGGGGGGGGTDAPVDTTQLPPQQMPTGATYTPTSPTLVAPADNGANPNFLKDMLAAVSAGIGAGAGAPRDMPPPPAPPEEKKKDKTVTYVLIGLAVIAVGAVIYSITKKKSA